MIQDRPFKIMINFKWGFSFSLKPSCLALFWSKVISIRKYPYRFLIDVSRNSFEGKYFAIVHSFVNSHVLIKIDLQNMIDIHESYPNCWFWFWKVRFSSENLDDFLLNFLYFFLPLKFKERIGGVVDVDHDVIDAFLPCLIIL